jgi:hypothetical protein
MSAPASCLVSGVQHGCPRCGIPIDALTFDDSSIVAWPDPRSQVTLARFELPPQYCGVLESFMQFTDAYAKDESAVETPTVWWRLLIDRHPVAPYTNLQWIVNPWGGVQPAPVLIKLPPGATVELIARSDPSQSDSIRKVGGRIIGRYWYDLSYGAVGSDRRAAR